MSEITQSLDLAFRPDFDGLTLAIKHAAVLDLKACRLSRAEIAEALTSLLKRNITVAQIDAITSETHVHRFPTDWVPAWIFVTGSRRILELLCTQSGLYLADETARTFEEYGRIAVQRDKLAERTASLKDTLWSKV